MDIGISATPFRGVGRLARNPVTAGIQAGNLRAAAGEVIRVADLAGDES